MGSSGELMGTQELLFLVFLLFLSLTPKRCMKVPLNRSTLLFTFFIVHRLLYDVLTLYCSLVEDVHASTSTTSMSWCYPAKRTNKATADRQWLALLKTF